MPETTYQFFADVVYGNMTFDDEHLNQVIIFLKDYYPFVIRLIYSDVYEMLLLMNAGNPKVEHLKKFIEMMIQKKDFALHSEHATENTAIFQFFYRVDDLQRIRFRENINQEQVKQLRKIYPLYGLEASSLIQGR
jgi:hypothetical protein